MLLNLHIENIAIISCLDLDFQEGFHVITGETGAGKSIIIDSIGLLIGGKSDKTLIRTGETQALVCGTFGSFSKEHLEFFEKKEIPVDDDGQIIIKRQLFLDGKNKIRINDSVFSLSTLKEIAPFLIDIHGQSDTLALYDSSSYIHILDSFSNIVSLQEEYHDLYVEYTKLKEEESVLNHSDGERIRQLEILKYQIEDIDQLHLKLGEDEELEELEVRIKNHEKILKQATFVYHVLKGADKGNALVILDKSIQALEGLSSIIPSAEQMVASLKSALANVEDVSEQVYDIVEEVGDSSHDINAIEERLEKISRLKKKYGPSIEEILEYLKKAKLEYNQLQHADERILEIKDELKKITKELTRLATALHDARSQASNNLEKSVIDALVFLDMPKVRFQIQIETQKDKEGSYVFNALGFDVVDFYISANSGEELHSLSKVASGGELARIMLALKSVENNQDQSIPMIFDEIDTGVSGKTARKIGMKLLELSKHTQIFCVTHSAQIASLADEHYLISKKEEQGRTRTSVVKLTEEGRIAELSRILGGIHITESQKQAAMDMRKEKEQWS